MKKLTLISSLFALMTLSSFAYAETTVVNCDSIRGSNRTLSLVIMNQQLRLVRIHSHGTRALMPNKILNQNIEGRTLYTLNGFSGLMEVENRVLTGEGGYLRLADDEFSCM